MVISSVELKEMINKNLYILKQWTPWIYDDLVEFAKYCDYSIILFRKPMSKYSKEFNDLNKKTKIYVKPFKKYITIKELLFVIKFIKLEYDKFIGIENFIVGIKSIFWFIVLDKKLFCNISSIHSEFATQATLVSILVKKYLNFTYQINFTTHAYDIFYNNKWFSYIYKNTNNCFTISNYNKIYISKKYNIPPSDISVIRAGVKIRKEKLVEFNYSIYKIGFLSNLIEKKGVLNLIAAIKLFKNRYTTKVNLIIAGEGPLRKKIEKLIEIYDLKKEVHLVGRITLLQKVEFFESISVFVLPAIPTKNDQDGIPKVIREAMSYGVPVISTNISGIPEICIDRETGILIEPNNIEQISDALNELYIDSDLRNKISLNAFKHLKKNYNISVNNKYKLKQMNWT